MKILIDLQPCQGESSFRGIGRYSMSLTKAIVRNKGNHDVYILLNGAFLDSIERIKKEFKGLLPKENILTFFIPTPVAQIEKENIWRSKVAELIREYAISQINPDIVHIHSLFEGFIDDIVTSVKAFSNNITTSVTIHDLIPLIHKEYQNTHPNFKDWYFKKIEYLKKADLFLAVSNSSKQEAVEYLSIDESKIVNTSEAVDEKFQKISIPPNLKQSILSKYGIEKPFIMYTPGGFDQRKNLDRLIHAFSKLPKAIKNQYQLVITSKIPDGDKERLEHVIEKAGLTKNDVIITGYVPDDELIAMYNLCDLFVFPSIHEGFGLPVLEAMACGAPVIGSNTTSIPEVIGREDALFDPYSVDSIANKIKEVLTDENFRNELREYALKRSKEFSWDKSAKIALEAFEDIKPSNYRVIYDITAEDDLVEKISHYKESEKELAYIAQMISLNIKSTSNLKQFFVDVSEISRIDLKTGIQRVVRAQLIELIKNPPKGYRVEPIYLTNEGGHWHYKYARKFTANILGLDNIGLEDEAIDYYEGDILYAPDLSPMVINAHKADLYKKMKAKNVSINFLVHDILPISNPEFFPEGAKKTHEDWVDAISSVSDNLICVSKSVADELMSYLKSQNKLREDLNITYIHNGADIENSVPTKGLPQDHERVLGLLTSKPSFLMVGTVEPRKGHLQTIKAFEILWQKGLDINLVIVGKEGWMVEHVIDLIRTHKELNKRLFWLSGISDEYLEKIYASSTCFIMASEGEGFGLPIIEAARYKLPIIARDIPVFREIAGDSAYYFPNDKSPQTLANTIENWLNLYKENKHPKPYGIIYITWKENVKRLLEVLLGGE